MTLKRDSEKYGGSGASGELAFTMDIPPLEMISLGQILAETIHTNESRPVDLSEV